ncbi:MAG: cupin domain-containing protein [Saprospirales bacterium]|nr:cupin domain-containing protein [Saprospirales bacterium]
MKDHLKTIKRRFDVANSQALLSGGAVLTWLATGKETGGQFSLFEAKGIPGMEPPPHVHENEDETYYLLEGEMLFRVGEEEFVGKPGDFVFLPRHVRHEFKVLSPKFRCLVGIYPAGLEEYFALLSVPYNLSDIPPLATAPPPPEAMEMMQKLDRQFGITYFME